MESPREAEINQAANSEIRQYFAGKTVFVTGATGFLGKLLVEKLLRTCHDVRRIYILIRPKKGKSCAERFGEYFDDPLYDLLKQNRAESVQKVSTINGDCALPDLALSERDKRILFEEVNCIFHVAATINFNETLRTATYISVRATRDLLRMCHQVKDLKSFVYVSTAYSFCPRPKLDEVIYGSMLGGDELLFLVETLTDDILDAVTRRLLGKWPNTYTFAKSVAENVLKKEGSNLPVAIVRPSAVVGTAQEPIEGWINNDAGAAGVILRSCLGLVRVVHCRLDCFVDLIPADYVVNTLLAVAWKTGKAKCSTARRTEANDSNSAEKSDIFVYNCVNSTQRPISWANAFLMGNRYLEAIPTTSQLWYFLFWPIQNRHVFLIFRYLLDFLPARIVDCFALCVGKKPLSVKKYIKHSTFMESVSYFTTRQWVFRKDTTKQLWSEMNSEDRKAFPFDMDNHDWERYFSSFARGLRVYLLKEPLDTLTQGRSKRLKLKLVHYVLVGFLFLAAAKLMILLCQVVL